MADRTPLNPPPETWPTISQSSKRGWDGTPDGPDRCDCGASVPVRGNEGYCDHCSGWLPNPGAACTGCAQFVSTDDLDDGLCDQCVQERAAASFTRASSVVAYAVTTAPWGEATRFNPYDGATWTIADETIGHFRVVTSFSLSRFSPGYGMPGPSRHFKTSLIGPWNGDEHDRTSLDEFDAMTEVGAIEAQAVFLARARTLWESRCAA